MTTYDAAKVKESYERCHPGAHVVGVYQNRKAALLIAARKPGRRVDLSYGYYIMIEEDK